MPKFPAKDPSAFRLSGYSYPGKSPVTKKYNPHSTETKRMTANQKKAAQDADPSFKGNKQKTGKELKVAKSTATSNVRNFLDTISGIISPKDASGKPQKKKITTKGGKINLENTDTANLPPPPKADYRGMKGGDSKYTYKKNTDGSYSGKNSLFPDRKPFTIKKGEGGYDELESSGLKKVSPTKLVKPKTEREKLNKLVKKRTKLKTKKEKLANRGKEGKKTLLGNRKRKVNTKRILKNQAKINRNLAAIEDLKKSKITKTPKTPKTPKKKQEDFGKVGGMRDLKPKIR